MNWLRDLFDGASEALGDPLVLLLMATVIVVLVFFAIAVSP